MLIKFHYKNNIISDTTINSFFFLERSKITKDSIFKFFMSFNLSFLFLYN